MKSFFKRHLPDPHKFREHHHLRHFGELLHDPNIWHLTRRSSSGGVATGLFCAFIPFPVHMLVAAALSILFRVNLPLAVLFTWITNPLTFAPLFIFAHRLGAFILDRPAKQMHFEMTFHWFTERLVEIWQPLLLGCFILATISATIGYFAIRMLWRLSAVRKWEERKRKNTGGKKQNSENRIQESD